MGRFFWDCGNDDYIVPVGLKPDIPVEASELYRSMKFNPVILAGFSVITAVLKVKTMSPSLHTS